ncbi:ATP-binding cassette sub-family C member 9-like [Patiria miniata]|uniref:Uncharacterized protein n=1 Tax=Patiria miniata TaxID=46514 RepID=A0A914BKQ7_PATMI|nr:ATP-binding cassette sub-family C member 9-like [Patiria miniata]
MYGKWEWFCGTNSTDMNHDDLDVWIGDSCLVHGVSTIPHISFIVVFSLALVLLRCFQNKVNADYLGVGLAVCSPGNRLHDSVRWLIGLGSLIVLAAAIGEGVLTDETYRAWQQSTQPHYYAPSAAAFIAMVLSLVYYHHMELWQIPSMSILLLIYWILALIGESLRLANLQNQELVDVQVFRFDLTVIMLVFYSALLLLEINLVRIKVLRRGWSSINEHLQNSNMHFVHHYVNLVSKATYWWMNWVFAKGYKKPLEHVDLGDIPERHQAHRNHKRLKEAYDREKARALRNNSRPSMAKVFIAAHGSAVLQAAVLKLIADLLNVIGPLCVGGLTYYVVTIAYPEDGIQKEPHYVTIGEFFENGFVLVSALFIELVMRLCVLHMYRANVQLEGGNIRAGLQAMIYDKALRLAAFTTTGGHMTMGQIANHMSADVANIMQAVVTCNILWSSPFQIASVLVLLYFQIGFSALLGSSLFIIVLPIQVKVAGLLAKKQKARLGCSDRRLKLTNELLQGIKLLKMYAWEMLYCKAVEKIRKKELMYLLQINMCTITSLFMTLGFPMLVTLVAFTTYAPLNGMPLTPSITFASLALFNQIILPLFNIPVSLSAFLSAKVSTKRLLNFLLAPEIEGDRSLAVEWDQESRPYSRKKMVSNKSSTSIGARTDSTNDDALQMGANSSIEGGSSTPVASRNDDPGIAVKITHGSFAWDPESDAPILSDINVEIPAGKLTMVIGQVGSGKSSLLSAILGEMTTVKGDVSINEQYDRMAYAAQRPWLLNASLRDNILFTSKLDSKRYNNVLEACALPPDIDILPAGDLTEIGEKGINLSGGQKQRVSVARAIYSDRDIVILDDPLSALDVHVGRQLFEEGLMKLLIANHKTVILVTHQLQYLSRADLILVIKDGRIAARGDLDDIIKADPVMYEEIKQVSAVGWDDAQAESADEERNVLQHSVAKKKGKTDGKLVVKEDRVVGSVSFKNYLYLMRNMGWGLVVLIFATAAMQTSSALVTNFWLSEWSEAGLSNQSGKSEAQYMAGYVGLSIASVLCQLMAFSAVLVSFLVAARRLHQNMLRNIIRAPLRFFDTTLVGRILNRFSNDTMQIDARMSTSFNGTIISFLQCFSSVVVVAIVLPVFLVFVFPIAVVFYFLRKYYLATSREIRRLDSTSKSPVFAHFSETLGGLSAIRAYRKERTFYDTILSRIDKNTTAFLYFQIGIRWLATRMEFLGASFVLLATLSTLIGAVAFGIDPGLVGLSSSYALAMSSYMTFLLQNSSEVETHMNAVERVHHYTDVETEDYGGEVPPPDWPQRGDIQIDNISVRYESDLDPVLSNISAQMKAGEKVGICGRTGSGKSSLALALLRAIDVFEGEIHIDDVDTKTVPLTVLRSKISIIPQDPLLFAGAIRTNLDPEGTLEDDDLWHALEMSQLKELVSQLDGGIDSKVTEGGENFSVGQRQLFCLARAFLRKSKILIMDEATASVDMETDQMLQMVLATAFTDQTVLTIAHRIETIRESDKIIVLDGGRVAEFGSPDELLADEDGMFTSLVGNN